MSSMSSNGISSAAGLCEPNPHTYMWILLLLDLQERMRHKFGASGGLGGGTMNSGNGKMVGIGSDPNCDPSRGGYASSGTDIVEIGQKGMKFLADSFAGLQVRLAQYFSHCYIPSPPYFRPILLLLCIECPSKHSIIGISQR